MTTNIRPGSELVVDNDGNIAGVDAHSRSIRTIDAGHAMVHLGFVYKAWHKFTGVADAASVYLHVKNPADLYPHLHDFTVTAGRGDVDVQVFETPTTSADGTLLQERSLNRNGTIDTSGLDVYHTPTVSSDGTEIRNTWIPPTAAGVGHSDSGAVEDADLEMILKPSTNYLIKITNNSGGSIDIHAKLYWYELNWT